MSRLSNGRKAIEYPFGGDVITVDLLCRYVPVYNEWRLRDALIAGCTSIRAVMMFLAQQDYEAGLKHRRASKKGRTTQRQLRTYARKGKAA
jgi:hypothetical protein